MLWEAAGRAQPMRHPVGVGSAMGDGMPLATSGWWEGQTNLSLA